MICNFKNRCNITDLQKNCIQNNSPPTKKNNIIPCKLLITAMAADKGLRYFLITTARSCMLSRNSDEDMGVHLKWTEAQARIGIYTTSKPSGSLQNPKDRRWGRYRDEMSLLGTDTTKTEQNEEIQKWMIQLYTYRFTHFIMGTRRYEKKYISNENVLKYKLYFSDIKICG